MDNNNLYSSMAIESVETSTIMERLGGKEVQYGDSIKTVLDIDSVDKSNLIGRPQGIYISYVSKLNNLAKGKNMDIIEPFSVDISRILEDKMDRVLVVGIGNEDMVADSLGSATINCLELDRSSNVYLLKTSVYGLSGIETSTHIQGVVNKLKPTAVILIDTLATSSLSRVYSSYQLTSAPLVPGGGVASARREIGKELLGVPTISIGVPLVIYIHNILKEYNTYLNNLETISIENGGIELVNKYLKELKGVAVTTKDIDICINNVAKVISQSIKKATKICDK